MLFAEYFFLPEVVLRSRCLHNKIIKTLKATRTLTSLPFKYAKSTIKHLIPVQNHLIIMHKAANVPDEATLQRSQPVQKVNLIVKLLVT